ncbi:LysR family transcriptional regulator [Achromobacter sp. GG226]|uniref:LysR family transcriptional regulator n=1 Tax=Verticiella alkaliphila TaxID=2779529 RepID=UPI001C0CB364|nr:LysR family transcriptional regulator [Verticiella sp. GG226]MBU4611158.1 LysR family transcriptional regulator [Verticiella sp. GG226]
MNLSTRQLRAFLALVDERHFTRAAERSHLSQPAFSALIRAVESEAGTRLFDRTTRHVEPTPEGLMLAASARRLLADFEGALAELHEHHALRRGRASIAALPSIAAGWLPPLLARFHAEHPGIALHVRDALLEPCLALVREGQTDFAIAAQGADMAGLATELFCRDRYHLVCRHDHPLAERARVRLADVAGYPLVQMAGSSSVRQRLDQLARDTPLATAFEVEHLATANGLVLAGLGVALVPALTLFQFRHDELVTRALQGRELQRSLYLVRRKGRSLSRAAQGLYERIREARPLGTD